MHPLLTKLVDSVFPPHPDVAKARHVTERGLFEKISLVYDSDTHIYTALPYRDEAVRVLIRANKFHHDAHAAHLLGAALWETLLQVSEEHALNSAGKRPVVVPIPSSSRRRRERGGNQIEWIVNAIPKKTFNDWPYAPHLLARHDRPSQAQIPKTARSENIYGAFFVPQNIQHPLLDILGASVFLIDDVSESGATMCDAMRALIEAGAQNVVGIALAK